MADAPSALHPQGLGATERRDMWWLQPALTVLGLAIGFGYLTWAAFLGDPVFGKFGHYLSPVYSPPLHEWFPGIMNYVPVWLSPAALVLWAPGGLRATCYYYRKAYYRSAFMSPPACAVNGQCVMEYSGEKKFPFILQNVHRFFMYLALVFVFWFLPLDIYHAFHFDTPEGGVTFGMGLGTLVLTAFWLAVSAYTLGCHSFRHLVGGKLDSFSSPIARFRYRLWNFSTRLTEKHQFWAWCSLACVCFADIYVRLLANQIISDIRFF